MINFRGKLLISCGFPGSSQLVRGNYRIYNETGNKLEAWVCQASCLVNAQSDAYTLDIEAIQSWLQSVNLISLRIHRRRVHPARGNMWGSPTSRHLEAEQYCMGIANCHSFHLKGQCSTYGGECERSFILKCSSPHLTLLAWRNGTKIATSRLSFNSKLVPILCHKTLPLRNHPPWKSHRTLRTCHCTPTRTNSANKSQGLRPQS
jgi:hypothetical protein